MFYTKGINDKIAGVMAIKTNGSAVNFMEKYCQIRLICSFSGETLFIDFSRQHTASLCVLVEMTPSTG